MPCGAWHMAWMTPQCCVPGTLVAGLSRILSLARNFHQQWPAPHQGTLGWPTQGSILCVEDVGAPKIVQETHRDCP